ncbi:hypothetical protein [Anabaena subtropica]|uniref:PepSY domain-containing protein n=1 Tax=Anabaena subtropica FACHB-260 TaxID=2692884 RepID=A0ABR8CLK9_9NOST|nr:hypothetical protein [Anabaena subtropica]MBD2343438.1 hypothetical protein [Anabaena subtropica FACHB-260]
MLQIYRHTKQAQIITALILTGILSVGSGFTFIKNAHASSVDFLAETPNELLKQNVRSTSLPRPVANAVLRDLSSREGISARALQITEYRQQTWRNGCLELQRPDELCTQVLVPGWRVVVARGRQTWIYHTNQTGSVVRLNERGNTSRLPQNVRNAVLRQASEVTRLPARALSILEFQPTNWVQGCDYRPTFPNPCDQNLVSGWQVTVGASNQRWVFVSNENGSRVQLKTGSNTTANLPPSIVQEVLADAANRARTKIALSPKNITQAERVVWSNGCLDLDGGVCTFAQVPGWRVIVTIGRERFVYHTDNNSLVKFNRSASNTIRNTTGTIQPVRISAGELPPPLDRNVLFRTISHGGFAGRTYETVLLNDGQLIRVRIGDANDSERSVRRLNRRQLQQFEQLLRRYGGEFNNLRYPASRGSADYITYTLTSQDGTVEYNDISQNNLPQDLQAIVRVWSNIVTNAQ